MPTLVEANNFYDRLSIMRKLGTLLATILVLSLVVPIGFAIFDPIEFHKVHPDMISDKGYGLYKIDTFFWGIDIADIELMSNSDFCFSNCYARLRVKPYQDIAFNSKDFGFLFSTILTDSLKFSDFDIYVEKEATDYWKEQVCSKWGNKSVYNKTSQEYTYTYFCESYTSVMRNKTYIKEIPISFSDFALYEDQEIYITIRGQKSGFENIDWRMKFLGYTLDEWIWWNGYNYSQNNTNPTTTIDIVMSLNGSAGVNGSIIWINPSQIGSPQALFIAQNRSYGNYSYANWSEEANFETENQTSGLNNSPTSLYTSGYAMGVYHLTHGFNSSTDMFNGTNFDTSVTNRSTDCAYGDCYEWSGGKLASTSEGIVTEFDFNSSQDFSIECWFKWDDVTTAQAGEDAYCGLFGDYSAGHLGMSFRTEVNCENIYGWISNGVADPDNSSTIDLNSGGRHLVTLTYNNTNSRAILWVNTTIAIVIDSDYADSTNELLIGGARYSAVPHIYVWDGEIDECRVHYSTLGIAEINATLQNFLNNNNMLGPVEQNGTVAITLEPQITNVSDQEYRLNYLTPVLIVNATNSFNWSLDIVNTNGSNYFINNGTQASGDWYNNTQTVNTSDYGDGRYFLNLSVIDSASNTAENISVNFTIQNLEVKLWNVSGNVYTQSNNIISPQVEIFSDSSATADLILYNGASSWVMAGWTLSAGNYSNSSIDYDVSNFSESDEYYIILNVTQADSWTESNQTLNFTIDTQGPNITFDWNLINGDWITSVDSHEVDLLIDDLTDTGILNCTIDSNGNDLSKQGIGIINTSTRQEATSFFRVAWNSSEWNGSYLYSLDTYLRVNETPSTATAMVGVILQNGSEYNTSTQTTTSTTYSLKEFTSPNTDGKVEWINLYIRNNNGNFTQVHNWTINVTGFLDGYNYSFPIPIEQGTNDFNITCRDKRNNSNSYNASDITIYWTQLTVLEEDNRTAFDVSNFSPRMIVQPSGAGNISYETTDPSEMTNSYFILMNDSIESIRLAFGTDYYRALTDYEDILDNITLYMVNQSSKSVSQILFSIQTVGYDRPILLRRPRDTGEDDITSEYPIGVDNEVNAYLLDSRLYNIYAYDELGNLIFIDSLMVAGARNINLVVPDTAYTFVSLSDVAGAIWFTNYTEDNYTLLCKGYDPNGVSFTITMYNSSDDQLATSSFSTVGTLTQDLGNISLLNNTYFYCVFDFGEIELTREIVILESGITFLNMPWICTADGCPLVLAIIVLLVMIALAGATAYYVGEIGLILSGVIGGLCTAVFGLPNILYIFALLLGIVGGAFLILKR